MPAKPTKFEADHYQKLVGLKIVAIQWEDIDGYAVPVLVFDKKNEKGEHAAAVVLSDPEGNGPGHLDIAL